MASIPRLHILPIRRLEAWIAAHGEEGCAILAASSQDTAHLRLPFNSICQQFDDVDCELPGRSMTPEQAQRYADFVRAQPGSTTRIICACSAGESRSAALCAALCEYYSTDASWIWDSPHYHPNMYVFSLFADALGVPVDDLRKDDLFLRNRRAFSDAIRCAREK